MEKGKWQIINFRQGCSIAKLEYIKKWRKWELVPNYNTGFTMDCLQDIIDFVKQLKSEVE